jgi:hypothetical protein
MPAYTSPRDPASDVPCTRGVPDPPAKAAALPTQQSRHRIGEGFVVLAKSVLGGLHHEYSVRLRSQDRVFA